MSRAIIFDVDGTLSETEETHRRAFNRAFAGVGLDWCWDSRLCARLLEVTGGKERIRYYIESFGGEGVLELIRDARSQGFRLAIATTTTPANVDALLGSTLGGTGDFAEIYRLTLPAA